MSQDCSGYRTTTLSKFLYSEIATRTGFLYTSAYLEYFIIPAPKKWFNSLPLQETGFSRFKHVRHKVCPGVPTGSIGRLMGTLESGD